MTKAESSPHDPASPPTRCEGRYPVPQTSPSREEPFPVTYRCAMPKGHDGPHGAEDSRPSALDQAIAEIREPPLAIVETAVEQAKYSTCRSQRGAVVFRQTAIDKVSIIARARNRKPDGFECDGTATCKATCRVEAVHAEQAALLRAGLMAQGSDLLHVKVVDGALVPSGPPSCVQCSKLALSAGIAYVWLFHADGWRRYTSDDFHRLSLGADRLAASRQEPEHRVIEMTAAQFKELYARASSPVGLKCSECQHVFTASDIAAEDPKAWGHPCHADGRQIRKGVTPCESYRELFGASGAPPVPEESVGEEEVEACEGCGRNVFTSEMRVTSDDVRLCGRCFSLVPIEDIP